MIVGILRNQNEDSVKKWEIACKNHGVNYKIINLSGDRWLEDINESKIDFFIHRPPGDLERYKNLFDERLYILSTILQKKIFPSYIESVIYENKRMLSYFLAASNIPHPKTTIFYNKTDALQFIHNSGFPIVGKSNIGAAGSGIEILRTQENARKYLNKAFSKKGLRRRFGPNKAVGTPKKWIKKALLSPEYFKRKIKDYLHIYRDSQYGYVILQEFIPHEYEWRIAKIGESYFGYKKIVVGEKASGAKKLEFASPPLPLLDFIRKIAEENSVYSAAFDVFPNNGTYLINEVQTIFGHSQPHILKVNNKYGRYLYNKGKWIFEEGDFNNNESYDLRLKSALDLFTESGK